MLLALDCHFSSDLTPDPRIYPSWPELPVVPVLFKTYFTDLFKEKGKQAVIQELVDYLNNWELEQGGSKMSAI